MIRVRNVASILAISILYFGATAVFAQEPAKPAQPAPAATSKSAGGTVMLEVTVSRYQGDKRLSSMPYTLAVSPGSQRSTLRVGGQVPIPTTTFTPSASKDPDAKPNPNPLTSYNYRDIGTNIDATAEHLGDGRYRILVTLEESSVYPPGEAAKNAAILVSTAPAFRSLRTSNYMVLKDGQSIEFTAATDRLSGETARLSVRLTVVN